MDVLRWLWHVTDWLAHGFGGEGVPYAGLVMAGLWVLLVATVVLGAATLVLQAVGTLRRSRG